MKEQLISFETAKLAKEKGFDFRTLYSYSNGTLIEPDEEHNEFANRHLPKNDCAAPTQSLLQKWLREEKGIMVWIEPTYYDGWLFNVKGYLPDGSKIKMDDSYDEDDERSYEKMLENVLIWALKSIK